MSNYVVIARFDNETNERFLRLGDELKKSGCSVPEWPPHITISAYENIDESLICGWTSAFSKYHHKVRIGMYSIGILPSGREPADTAVLCIAPAHSKAFVDFYYEFHEKHEEYCTGIGYYNSITHGNPIMHATLATINIADVQSAMNVVFKSNVFGVATVTALEVYTYPMRLINRFELG